jgi:large subunit ribosomal protein L21
VYAVIQTGGKQYKVKPGDIIKVEKIDAPIGSKVNIPNLLMIFDEKEIKLDPKLLETATVEGKILKHGKHKKVLIFKKKRRKGFQKKRGHRQNYSELIIENINLG